MGYVGILSGRAAAGERERLKDFRNVEWVDVAEKSRMVGPPASTQLPAGCHLTA